MAFYRCLSVYLPSRPKTDIETEAGIGAQEMADKNRSITIIGKGSASIAAGAGLAIWTGWVDYT